MGTFRNSSLTLAVLVASLSVCCTTSNIEINGIIVAEAFELAALKGYTPPEEDAVVQSMNDVVQGMQARTENLRMLFSYEQQVDIFRDLFGKNASFVESLKAEPDVCDKIKNFVGAIYDSAATLLIHRAGRKHHGMRAFQQVLHIRAILRLVLKKMKMPLDTPVDTTVCVDKSFMALYGWVKGTLIAEAKHDNVLLKKDPELTDEQKLSLAKKRGIATTTTLDAELVLEDVKPMPGADYSE